MRPSTDRMETRWPRLGAVPVGAWLIFACVEIVPQGGMTSELMTLITASTTLLCYQDSWVALLLVLQFKAECIVVAIV